MGRSLPVDSDIGRTETNTSFYALDIGSSDVESNYGVDDVPYLKNERLGHVNGNQNQEYLRSNPVKSGTTTSFPQPALMSSVDVMDVRYCSFQDRSYCSNCYEKISSSRGGRQGKKFADILCNRKSTSTKRSDDGVTIFEALDVIFELNKKSFLSEIILDEMEYTMCWNCCNILSKLYKIYLEFTECTRSPSYIKAVILHNKPLNDIQGSINEAQVPHNPNPNYDDSNPHLNFEVSFQEEDDSYDPPEGQEFKFTALPPRERRSQVSRRKREDSDYEYAGSEDEEKDLKPVKRGRGRPRKDSSTFPAIKNKAYPLHSINSKGRIRKPDPRKEKDRRLRHKCHECSAMFSRPSRLQRHLNVHSGGKYVCSKCNAGFKFSIFLERHEVEQHSEGKIECSDNEQPKVGKTSETKRLKSLRDERRKAHLCRDCGLVFTTPSGLNRHARLHENLKFPCDQADCSAEFISMGLLVRHKINTHQMDRTEASVFPNPGSIKRRKIREENVDMYYVRLDGNKNTRRYQCPHCPRKFFRTDHISRHIHVHAEQNHICDTCDCGFSTLRNLKEHIKLTHKSEHKEGHENVSPVKPRIPRNCPEEGCTYSFTRTNHLKQHLQSKHNIIGRPIPVEEPQRCPVCNLILKSKGRLDIHLNKNHRPLIRDINYECDVCGKRCRDANNLKNHKACHVLAKSFICDKCGFATKRSYQLTRHIEMVHVGTRSHPCPECDLSFKKKQHLLDHMNTHRALEYRPYTCTIEGCSKAYRSKRNLRQHLEAHGNCKFQCETCGRIFTRKDNLKVHVDTVHLGKPGRTHKEKVKIEGGGPSIIKRTRKKRQSIPSTFHTVKSSGTEVIQNNEEEVGQTHQVMIVEDANVQHLQHHPQFHLLTDARIIQQGTIPSQNLVAIPNPFGEFFYTL